MVTAMIFKGKFIFTLKIVKRHDDFSILKLFNWRFNLIELWRKKIYQLNLQSKINEEKIMLSADKLTKNLTCLKKAYLQCLGYIITEKRSGAI